MELGIQLYTLRDVDESLPETLERLGETRYSGVEFAGFGDSTPAEIAATLESTGLDVAGAHVGVDEIETEYERIVEAYGTIGCNRLVVPSYERDAFETEVGARAAGERLAELADRLAKDGFDLHYHNHTFEFAQFENETAFDVFAEAIEGVGLEIDVGLANHANVDPVDLLERYGDRLELLHLTDSDPAGGRETHHMDLGDGTVDIPACIETATEQGAQWVVFEHGLTDDPLASMAHAEETLAGLLE